jgi:hypothetical protein
MQETTFYLWEEAMRTLKMLFGVGLVIALLGLNVATADIKNGGAGSLTFPVDTGDGTASMPDVTFDSTDGAGGDEAQTTCAMTPGGTSSNALLPEPFVPPTDPDTFTDAPLERLANDSLRSPPSPNRDRQGRPLYPPPLPPADDNTTPPTDEEEPPPPPATVPEPATLLVFGLGLGATALVSRRRRKI